MTKIKGISCVLVALVSIVTISLKPAFAGFTTKMRVAASTCDIVSDGHYVDVPLETVDNNSAPQAGRIRTNLGSARLKVYCPVTDMPTVVDITNPAVVNRASVLISTPNPNPGAAVAQLCSDDNSGSTIGGSCQNGAWASAGAGVHAIDISMSGGSNWHAFPSSLHYIFISVLGSSTQYGYVSGYTLWHETP